MKVPKVKEIVTIALFVFAACIIVLLLSWGFITVESVSSFMSEFNKLFPNISSAFLAVVATLIGVFLGWFLSNQTQKRTLKISEIKNELEKAYGILYSMVSKPEEFVKVDGGNELRVVVSREERKELNRILMSYPHMFPLEIVVLWRTEIRNLKPVQIVPERVKDMSIGIGIPVKFKEEITKEYEQRLEEYYKITGRKSLKGLPKLARA